MPTPTPSTNGFGCTSSNLQLQVVSYNVHSCVGTDGAYSTQRIVDVLAAIIRRAASVTSTAAKEERHQAVGDDDNNNNNNNSQHDRPSSASSSPPTFTIVALQEIESNGVRARRHRYIRSNNTCDGNDGDEGDSDNGGGHAQAPPPIRTRIWSAPHADDQPHVIADGLAPATTCTCTGTCGDDHHQRQYHVSFAPAISSVARDRCHERHGDPDSCNNNSGGGDMGQFGIAILSQLPILETRIHRYKRYREKTLRNAQACLILLPQSHAAENCQGTLRSAIWVVNTHLGCHSGGEQYEQAMELVGFLQSLSSQPSPRDIAPLSQIILCGDFNSPPFFRSMDVIRRAGFVDTWEVSGVGNGRGGTFPSDGRVPGVPSMCSLLCCCRTPMLRLDYIWFRDEGRGHAKEGCERNGKGDDERAVVPRRACVVNNDVARCASDHLPIVCYFDVHVCHRQ